MAKAAFRPPTVSQTGKPQRSGCRRFVAVDVHGAGQALDDLVVGRLVGVGTGLAEARDAAVDEARLERGERRVAEPQAGMTSGRKFSTTTSAPATSFLKISLPSADLRFSVSDFLLAFWARKLVPISILLYFGTLPRTRARSPAFGFSILTTSAPSNARWSVQNGPDRTLVRSSTRTPESAPTAQLRCARTGAGTGTGPVR